jgi:hypothetical protein
MDNVEERQVEMRNAMENMKENCEMIWKIWKKIVKRFGKYRRK